MCGHNFHAGELGPGTIVGSAAFNMFVIIGLCVLVIPEGESRKIQHLEVYFVTAFWSIFAYIWLYLILAVISPGIVEVGFLLHWYDFSFEVIINIKSNRTFCLNRFGRHWSHCFIFQFLSCWLGSQIATDFSWSVCASIMALITEMAS